MISYNTEDIRRVIMRKYRANEFTTDRSGVKTIELLGATFVADDDYIIKKPDRSYIDREIEWYVSQSLNVNDIPGGPPKIWTAVSSNQNLINSNYGYLIWSKDNGSQYDSVLEELKKNPNSRRAVMIYNRPSMHTDAFEDGMNDFVCTYANSFMIRDGKLFSHYIMRSNDAVFGYNNDISWARYVQNRLANDLGILPGDIVWTASNFHVYEHHFGFIEEMIQHRLGNMSYSSKDDPRFKSAWKKYLKSIS